MAPAAFCAFQLNLQLHLPVPIVERLIEQPVLYVFVSFTGNRPGCEWLAPNYNVDICREEICRRPAALGAGRLSLEE